MPRRGEMPSYKAPGFHCPHCDVYANQGWFGLYAGPIGQSQTPFGTDRVQFDVAACGHCGEMSLWTVTGDSRSMIWPVEASGPLAHTEMPPDVARDYEEARSIAAASPRGACALLRLANEKLINQLQPEGRDLNDRIGKLVATGMPSTVQQAMDGLRIVGNEAVHPGELDLRDDVETAGALFELLNLVVEDRIAQPARVAALYSRLPPKKVAGVEDRDRPNT